MSSARRVLLETPNTTTLQVAVPSKYVVDNTADNRGKLPSIRILEFCRIHVAGLEWLVSEGRTCLCHD